MFVLLSIFLALAFKKHVVRGSFSYMIVTCWQQCGRLLAW